VGTSLNLRVARDHNSEKSLHKIKHLFKWGAIHKVGDDKLTSFWNDVWLESSLLRICFPELFEVCDSEVGSVADYAARGWHIGLRHMLGTEEMREWTDLQELLRCVNLTQQEDVVSWGLTPSKVFSTSYLYRFMTNGGMGAAGWQLRSGNARFL
jgi:hypothetical protein